MIVLYDYGGVADGAPPSLTYDLNGNLTADGTWTYTYDTENHLLSVARSGSSNSYVYDPLGRRLAKTVNGVTTRYLSLGSQEIAEYDGANTLLRRYVFGPGLDEPLATIDAAGSHSYHFTDVRGSIVALVNSSGAVGIEVGS